MIKWKENSEITGLWNCVLILSIWYKYNLQFQVRFLFIERPFCFFDKFFFDTFFFDTFFFDTLFFDTLFFDTFFFDTFFFDTFFFDTFFFDKFFFDKFFFDKFFFDTFFFDKFFFDNCSRRSSCCPDGYWSRAWSHLYRPWRQFRIWYWKRYPSLRTGLDSPDQCPQGQYR